MSTSARSTRRTSMPGSGRGQRTKQRAFLSAFRRTGTVTGAAREAAVSRSAHYAWLDSDIEYAERFEAANEEATDELEQEARRRALEGVEELVFRGGERVGTIRKYSDPLLMMLLRAKRPHQFKESVDVTSRTDDVMAAIDPEVMKNMTDEEVSSARALLRKLAGLETSTKVTP